MNQLEANLPHMLVALGVIAAAVVLAALHVISGGEGVTLIAGAGGFSMGAGAGSASASGAAPTVSASTSSTGDSTVTVTPKSVAVSHPGTPVEIHPEGSTSVGNPA